MAASGLGGAPVGGCKEHRLEAYPRSTPSRRHWGGTVIVLRDGGPLDSAKAIEHRLRAHVLFALLSDAFHTAPCPPRSTASPRPARVCVLSRLRVVFRSG
jgi:hypothetical protein